jgi:hypothetical protein
VAELLVDGTDLVLHLRLGEKFWGLHSDIRVPLITVRSVTPIRNPWLDLRGWRMAGLAYPGSISLGTRRHAGGLDFCALRRMRPALQVDLYSGRFSRLLVSLPEGSEMSDAQKEADQLADAAGIPRSDPIN